MTEGRRKSRTLRRMQTRTPSGKLVTHYLRRKPAKAQCAGCRDYLKGMTRALPNKMFNTPKTKKRPQRPFGGVLCSRCARKEIIGRYRHIFSLKAK